MTSNLFQAQSFVVSMPNEECIDCVLRFERQALEWGDSYRFQSCADIDVVTVSLGLAFAGCLPLTNYGVFVPLGLL